MRKLMDHDEFFRLVGLLKRCHRLVLHPSIEEWRYPGHPVFVPRIRSKEISQPRDHLFHGRQEFRRLHRVRLPHVVLHRDAVVRPAHEHRRGNRPLRDRGTHQVRRDLMVLTPTPGERRIPVVGHPQEFSV